jgi:hypothetical protein
MWPTLSAATGAGGSSTSDLSKTWTFASSPLSVALSSLRAKFADQDRGGLDYLPPKPRLLHHPQNSRTPEHSGRPRRARWFQGFELSDLGLEATDNYQC